MTTTTTPRTYVRGTKVRRATTASLRGGEVLLTADSENGEGRARNVATKTGAILRTVVCTEATMTEAHGFHGRRGRRYDVHFTDGTVARNLAPSETWGAVEAPVAEPAPEAPEAPAPVAEVAEVAEAGRRCERERAAGKVYASKLAKGDRVVVRGHKDGVEVLRVESWEPRKVLVTYADAEESQEVFGSWAWVRLA